jgi:hypothetical protein
MQAEAEHQQTQLAEAMNALQDAYNATPEEGSLNDNPSGGPPPAPSDGFRSGPTALCWDGTYSYSANRQGTCSHHDGVMTWYS